MRALAAALLAACNLERPLTFDDLLGVLAVRELTLVREALAGNARAIILPDRILIGPAEDPDGDPWTIAHAIAHAAFDLDQPPHAYVCIENDQVRERRADLFAGFLLLGDALGTDLATWRRLAVRAGVGPARAERFARALACPTPSPVPTLKPIG